MKKTPFKNPRKPMPPGKGFPRKRKPLKSKPYRPLPAERVTLERLHDMKLVDIGKNVAWPMMSRYVRMRDDGKGCVTCGNKKDRRWQEMEAGHFKHAGKCNPVSYDPRNINSQCHSCNGEGSGRGDVYAEKLEEMYGFGIIQELVAMKNMSLKGKDKRQFMYDTIADLQEKLKTMNEGE